MIKKISIFLFLAAVLTSFNLSDYFSKKTLVYQDKKNGVVTKSDVTISNKNNKILVTKTSNQGLTNLKYKDNYKILDFSFKGSRRRNDYTFKKGKNAIICQGISKGKRKSASHTINDKNWVQDFGFGFTPFLKSEKSEYKFIMVNPNDFTTNDMIAIKQRKETLKINDKEYKTQKIKVTLTGFKSHFWKAEIWFDTHTHSLVKYASNEGPGTPMTITTLIENK